MWIDEKETEIRESLDKLDLFDAGAWLGSTPAFPLMERGTPELLERIHGESYIKGALISRWPGSEGESFPARESWYAIETALPGQDFNPSERVKAARIFPASMGFSPLEGEARRIFSILTDKKMPLFLMHTEISFSDLDTLAAEHPGLNIVLESQTKKILYHMGTVLPMMQRRPNILLEISNLCNQGIIEYIVKNFGPDRLVFGSFAPASDPLVPAGMILQAGIPEDAKREIAGGNMRRMISEVAK